MDKPVLDKFGYQDLDDIMLGAHFYACGGGGALENGTRLIEQTKQALQKRGADGISYMSATAIADDGWAPVLGAIGAPQKFLRYGYGKSPVSAFLAHERLIQIRLGDPSLSFCSLVPAETGTIAHAMALLVAATLGLPIVDGDGAGRAIPSLPMVTFANPQTKANIPLSPCALTSEKAVKEGGAVLNLDCNDSATADALARGIISAKAGFEDRASLSCFAMTGAQMKQPGTLVHGMLSRVLELGRHIRTSSNPIDTVKSLPSAKLICNGTITHVTSATRGGFDWLDVHIQDPDRGQFVVVAKNENMLVWSKRRDTPVVLAPDLICYMQPDGTVLSNSEIQLQFQRENENVPVALFSLDAPGELSTQWTHSQFAKVFENYGYYGGYHPPLS